MVNREWWMNQPDPNAKPVLTEADKPSTADRVVYRKWYNQTEKGKESIERSQKKYQARAKAAFPNLGVWEGQKAYARLSKEERKALLDPKPEHQGTKNLWWDKPGAVNPLKGKRWKNKEEYAPKQTYANYYKEYFRTEAGKVVHNRSNLKYKTKISEMYGGIGYKKAAELHKQRKLQKDYNNQGG